MEKSTHGSLSEAHAHVNAAMAAREEHHLTIAIGAGATDGEGWSAKAKVDGVHAELGGASDGHAGEVELEAATKHIAPELEPVD